VPLRSVQVPHDYAASYGARQHNLQGHVGACLRTSGQYRHLAGDLDALDSSFEDAQRCSHVYHERVVFENLIGKRGIDE
jgi:hypothetical protein